MLAIPKRTIPDSIPKIINTSSASTSITAKSTSGNVHHTTVLYVYRHQHTYLSTTITTIHTLHNKPNTFSYSNKKTFLHTQTHNT